MLSVLPLFSMQLEYFLKFDSYLNCRCYLAKLPSIQVAFLLRKQLSFNK